MKRSIWLIGLMLCVFTGAMAVTIFEVQYTSSRGVDNSYPSPYLGREVTLEGVVTAVNYRDEGYFLSERVSGAWRGIYVNDSNHNPSLGDFLRVTGEVAEHFGMTSIDDVSNYHRLDSNRALPAPVTINSGQLASALEAEAYEGVYARVVNVSASGAKVKNGRFLVNDGSGQCSIALQSFGSKTSSPAIGTQYAQIAGVVSFSYGEYTLNPVSSSDLHIQQPVSTQNKSWGKIKSIYK
jgi:predicted extracellular nuclease